MCSEFVIFMMGKLDSRVSAEPSCSLDQVLPLEVPGAGTKEC